MEDCLALQFHSQLKQGNLSLEELYVIEEELSAHIAAEEYLLAEREELEGEPDNGN